MVLKMVSLVGSLLLSAWPTLSAAEELSAEKIRDIKALMGITMNKEADQAVFSAEVTKGLRVLKQRQPELSEQAMGAMHAEAIRLFAKKRDEPGGLVDRLVVVYHNHFTHDDVKEVLEFFETPIGRKTRAFLAVKQTEVQPIVQQWGTELAGEWARSMIDIMMKEAMPPPM